MKKSKKMCIGCYNNFYNGNNNLGIKECWSYVSSKIIERVEVGINEMPPYYHKPRKFLNCYRKSGYAYLTPEEVINQRKRIKK